MSKNLEIKAYCSNPEKTEMIVKKIATSFFGTDKQTDTYFITKNGRFKLRESLLSGAYLVPYLRSDQSEAKISKYEMIQVENVQNTKDILKELFGIQTIIKKKRKIYLVDNVRIHLDHVENLGTFIEFEAVFDEINNELKTEEKKIKELMLQLEIKKEDLIADSYENLMKDKLKMND